MPTNTTTTTTAATAAAVGLAGASDLLDAVRAAYGRIPALTNDARGKRVRIAEVEARDAHCEEEQADWEDRRTEADASGNERAVTEANARLLALEQARRRNAATVGRVRAELAEVERQLLDAQRLVADDEARRAYDEARAQLDDLTGVEGRMMVELRGSWLPEFERVQQAVRHAADCERVADRLAGRPSRSTARTFDDLGRHVPGGLWRLRVLQAIARNEPVEPPSSASGSPGSPIAREILNRLHGTR
jgi:hypothetical protein